MKTLPDYSHQCGDFAVCRETPSARWTWLISHRPSMMVRPVRQTTILVLAVLLTTLLLPMRTRAGAFTVEPYALNSGLHANPGSEELLAFSHAVDLPDKHRLRLRFSQYNLGRESFVLVTSVQDGHQQRLDTGSLPLWNNLSAIFNGGQLQLDLYVAPGETGIFFSLDALLTSCDCRAKDASNASILASLTSCEGNDDRVASTDFRIGRLGQCSAYLVANGAVVSAAHCPLNANDVFEVNVPPSQPNGALTAAAPQDQYPVDLSFSRTGESLVWGNDWRVFGLRPHPNTGQRAHRLFGFFRVTKQKPAADATIRVTGYGIDNEPISPGSGPCPIDLAGNVSSVSSLCNSYSRTLQTALGFYRDEQENSSHPSYYYHRYRVYTHSGNSGSPIIWEATGAAIGIHAFGCRESASGYYNLGTSFRRSTLEAALQDFQGPNVIYLDAASIAASELGSVLEPYRTVAPAVQAAQQGNQLFLVSGSFPQSAGGNTGTFGADGKAMTWTAPVGPVTIGGP